MQSPGWYPDPSGQPRTFRFWDGAAWTPVTTQNPHTPAPAGGPRAKAPVVIAVAAALVLGLVAVVGVLVANRGDRPVVEPTPAPTNAGPPTSTAGTGARLNCSGGNGTFSTRREQPFYTAAGVVYDAVPGWSFSFDPSYWSWLDDHSAMGAIRLDGGDNEAGIALGGIRHENGFADQATAGELSAACLEGTLSVESPTTASTPTTDQITLGGMRTYRTRVEFTDPSAPRPLQATIYVIDSGQPGKWAEIITFARRGSSANALIDKAMATVRHS